VEHDDNRWKKNSDPVKAHNRHKTSVHGLVWKYAVSSISCKVL